MEGKFLEVGEDTVIMLSPLAQQLFGKAAHFGGVKGSIEGDSKGATL